MSRTWETYKNRIRYYKDVFDQYRQDRIQFTCYVDTPESYKITPSALMELNTSFLDLFTWFVLPLLIIGSCWVAIVFTCYWYGCPCGKKKHHTKMYKESTCTDFEESDMSRTPSGGLGRSNSNEGGWPKAGPSDGDTGGSWPMYWR